MTCRRRPSSPPVIWLRHIRDGYGPTRLIGGREMNICGVQEREPVVKRAHICIAPVDYREPYAGLPPHDLHAHEWMAYAKFWREAL